MPLYARRPPDQVNVESNRHPVSLPSVPILPQSESSEGFHILRTMQADNGSDPVAVIRRAAVSKPAERWIRKRDLRAALRLLSCFLAVHLLPRTQWERVSAWPLLRQWKRRHRRSLPGFTQSVANILGPSVASQASELLHATLAARHRGFVALAAGLSRRWRPELVLRGADGLHAALARGHGAIIWCQPFVAQTLMGKRALHEAGFAAHQLSISGHGISNTRFSRAFLNPLVLRQEDACLAGRIYLDHDSITPAVRRMIGILRDNGIMLITQNDVAGSVFLDTPLGPAGHVLLASTPINLALRTGAALFCMRTIEAEPLRRYEATILPEIPLPQSDDTARDETMAGGARHARDQLLEGINRYPEQSQILLG